MKQAVANMLERLLTGKSVAFNQIVWAGLVVCLLFAVVHLITMLITRWGDRQAMTKSLIFSLLVHVSCALGLVAFNPPQDPSWQRETEDEEVEVRMVFVEGEERIETDDPGNTPVWDRLPEPENVELARMERQSVEPLAAESPERVPESVTRPEVDVPDLPSLPEQDVATPKPEQLAEVGVHRESAIPLNVDDPTAEARPEIAIPSSSNARVPIPRDGQIDTEVSRQASRGTIDRVEMEFDPARQLASLDAPADPNSFLKRAPEDEVVRRRVGPVPSPIEEPQAGTAASEETEGADQGSPVPPQPNRLRTVTPRSEDDGAIERFQPERTPQTVDPEIGPPVHVRDVVDVPTPRDGPQPNVIRPNFDAVVARDSTMVPSTYRLRNLARRKEIAREFGGTEESERAVEASLRWFSLNQSPEGFWDADRFGAGLVGVDENGVNRQNAGKQADTGVTALAVLAFLGAGYTHEEGQYANHVDSALQWLISQQKEDGNLGGEATYFANMYCHAMATYALAEAYGMQSDPTTDARLRQPISKALAYILDQQNAKDGGWRYRKNQESDMSMFGWQLMALKSAEIAGFSIPRDARTKMVQFLKDHSLGEHNGLARYQVRLQATPSMTAEALFCKQMLGIRRSNPGSIEAVQFLLAHPPKRSELNLYYWYYGTLAMYQFGGESWQKWNEAIRDQLVADQRTSGDEAGSWDPKGPWGPYGGRVYSTALSALCLEVYYRFLPLYQMGGRYDHEPDLPQ